MRRIAAALAAATLAVGLIGVSSAPASAGAVLKPRASTPKALGFGANWSPVFSSRACVPASTVRRCRSGVWIRPDKVGRPLEFNQNVGYSSIVYPSTKAARRAVTSWVARIRADPAAYGSLVVRRKKVSGVQRTWVSYTYLGPHQRQRGYIAQKGRRTASVSLGSDTPLGALPAGKLSVMWRTLAFLVR